LQKQVVIFAKHRLEIELKSANGKATLASNANELSQNCRFPPSRE
jgi:hypothetical protein